MAREPKRLHFGNKCAEWSRKDRLCYCNYLNREEHKGAFINQNKMLLHITADCAPNVNLTANKPASQRSSLTVMSTEKSDHSNQKWQCNLSENKFRNKRDANLGSDSAEEYVVWSSLCSPAQNLGQEQVLETVSMTTQPITTTVSMYSHPTL